MAQKVEYELSLKDLLSGKLREADSAAKGLENTVKNIATTIGAAFAISKIKDFAMSIVDVGSKIETLDNVIKYTSINAEDAAKNHEFLNHIINDYKLPILETTEGFSNLSAAMLGSSLQGQGARDVFEGVSIASTAMHLSAEKTNAVFYALNNMMSNGTVQAQDLKLQLGNALPGAFNLAAKSMGMTQVAFKKLMEEGGIVSSEFLPKFASYLKQEFSGAIPAAVESTTANMTELSNKFLLLKNQMFQDLKPAITSIIEGLSDLIKWLKDGWNWLVQNKESIKNLAIGFGLAFGPLLAFKGLMIAVNIVLRANPIMLVVTAIGFLISGFVALYREGGPFRDFCDGLVEGFKSVYNFITDIVDGIVGLKNTIVDFFDTISPFTKSDGSKTPLFGIDDSWQNDFRKKDSPMASLEERRAYENLLGMKNGMFYDPSDQANSMGLEGVKAIAKNKIPIDGKDSKERNKRDVSAKGAVGNRSVTINIKMDNMIKEFKLGVTNITEGTAKVREMVTQAMLSAINDSQIIGNR